MAVPVAPKWCVSPHVFPLPHPKDAGEEQALIGCRSTTPLRAQTLIGEYTIAESTGNLGSSIALDEVNQIL